MGLLLLLLLIRVIVVLVMSIGCIRASISRAPV